MNDANNVHLIGEVSGKPLYSEHETGHRVVLRVATKEFSGNSARRPLTMWHSVVAWDQIADDAARLLSKGSRIRVDGSLHYRKYKDDDGIERLNVEVKASNIQLLDS